MLVVGRVVDGDYMGLELFYNLFFRVFMGGEFKFFFFNGGVFLGIKVY